MQQKDEGNNGAGGGGIQAGQTTRAIGKVLG
jgi:hypothetical protein